MANPLFNALGGAMLPGLGNIQNLMQQFQQFQRTFTGDARQQVQQLLNSGTVSQTQYNQAVQIAQQFQRMMGGR